MYALRGPIVRWIGVLLLIAVGALAGSFGNGRRPILGGGGTQLAAPGALVAGTGHAPPGSRPGYDPTLGACSGPRVAQAVLFGVGPVCAPWDSIPAIDHPRFLPASKVRFVRPDEPVIALDWRGSDRAYPVQILAYHEIVNDDVNGRPIAVTFCPLCNSGVAFSRRVDGRTLTFAVTGQLNFANLVMFDRETVSEWRQLEGVAISGPFKGTRLKLVPVQMVSLGEWRAAHSSGLVMRRPPASPFHYGVDPYHGYDLDPGRPSVMVRDEPTDPRLPPKWRVVGVAMDRGSVAFPAPKQGSGSAVETARLGQLRLVAFFRYGVAQPEMNYQLSTSPRGWSGSVWVSRLGGRDLRFIVRRGRFVETTTGSEFDFFGRGISGPLSEEQLLAPPQATAFWFAWSAFHPHTRVAKGP
jgi:hypothetical protein